MITRSTCTLTAFYAIIMGNISFPERAIAMQAQPTLAAEKCVTYREDGQGGFHLSNTCDYDIDIAFCSQPKNEPGLCLRNPSWRQETLQAQSEGQTQVYPEQALDLFACRKPGAIEILPSGMARCLQPVAPAIPTLLSASLKNPGSIITEKDYPASQHRNEGTTRFDLMVGPDGKPTSCTTTQSSGFDTLDKSACQAFLKRARFSPAKDSAGNATTGRYKGSVTWKAP